LLWSLLVYMGTRQLVVRISNATKNKVIPDTILVLSLVLEWVIISIRNWTGQEEFVPVASFTGDAPDKAMVVSAPNRPKENQ
jgi:hypothetical protein